MMPIIVLNSLCPIIRRLLSSGD